MAWQDVFGDMSLGGLLGTILTGAGYANQLSDLKSFGQQAQRGAEGIGQQASQATQFVPFTVTGATGSGISTTPEGSTAFNLSGQEQGIQNQLFGGASEFLRQANLPVEQRQQELFGQTLEMMTPQRELERLNLEERLAAQGRLGVSSNAYAGATPEQLALARAQEEQLKSLVMDSRNQALAEQQRASELGQGMLGSAYIPQASMLNMLQSGLGVAGLSDTARRQAAMLQSEAQMGGLDAALQAQLARGNLTGQGLAALAGALGGQQQATTGLLSGVTTGDAWDFLKGLFT
jgi:hypothetical protein